MRVIDNLSVQLCISSKITRGLSAPEQAVEKRPSREKRTVLHYPLKCKCPTQLKTKVLYWHPWFLSIV